MNLKSRSKNFFKKVRKIGRKRESPNRLEKVSLEECKRCEGTGIDSEGVSLGNPYNCINCRGTRFKEGEKAENIMPI